MFICPDPQQSPFEFFLVGRNANKPFGAASQKDLVDSSIGRRTNVDFSCPSSKQHRDNACDCVRLACPWWSLYQLDLLLRHVQNSFQYLDLTQVEFVFVLLYVVVHLTLP